MILSLFFWSCLFFLGYIYMGYPLVLKALSLFYRQKPLLKSEALPFVSLLISAYNEETSIEKTIQNKLELDYPKDRLEILVASDGSTDRTDEIVKKFEGHGVRLFRQNPRKGKTAALNNLVENAQGEILVFSDANSLYDKNAVKTLIQNFSDERIGYVTGKMVYVDEKGTVIGSGCSAYMRYENALRSLETKTGSVIGVDGGVDAVRKDLYEPMPADALPDFVLPLTVISKGKKVAFEPNALLKEETLTETADEWKMRTRVALRSFWALKMMKSLLNPFRYPMTSFQIFSHKIFRYMAGFFQIGALVSNALLALESPFFLLILWGQGGFYLLAALGANHRWAAFFPPSRYAFYFCLLNASSLVAFFQFLVGKKQVTWNPRKG